MFTLSKLISRLLFPVAMIIELFIAGLILVHFRHRRLGYCFCVSSLILLFSASMDPVADSFLWTLERRYPPIVKATPKLREKIGYIVVLGSGHSERSELSGAARLSPSGNGRVVEAVRLSREFPGIPLIFTGGVFEGKVAAGEAASIAAIGYGLSPSRVIVERLARNTAEEARAVSILIRNKTVILVTSASHMRRALGLFQAARISVIPAPADYLALGGPYSLWHFIPSANALQKAERAWYEYMGLAWNAIGR